MITNSEYQTLRYVLVRTEHYPEVERLLERAQKNVNDGAPFERECKLRCKLVDDFGEDVDRNAFVIGRRYGAVVLSTSGTEIRLEVWTYRNIGRFEREDAAGVVHTTHFPGYPTIEIPEA